MMGLRSMTGFARARKAVAGGEIVVSVKSLNHRGLDLHFHMPAELDPFENGLRAAVKGRVARGHVEVRVSLVRSGTEPALGVNKALLDAYVASFRRAASEYGLDEAPDLNAALRLPGMFGETQAELGPEVEAALPAALEEALDELNAFREREGAQIGELMRRHNEAIERAAEGVEQMRSQATAVFQARLAERLSDLLKGAGVEPQRLAQEVAILTDRTDIGEETARLKIHSRQLGELLETGGEVGKKLDFLLQEMNRETNTILSKTTGAGEIGLAVTDLALPIKADIEKIREQSLNLE